MFLNFYAIPGDASHEDMEFVFESPEEYQKYCRAMPSELPAGHIMAAPMHGIKRIQDRNGKRAQPTIRIGVRKAGESLALDDSKQPLPAPPIKALGDVPQNVQDASDEKLEVMAARAGVKVTEQWRRRNRALRNSDVTSAMAAVKVT